MSGYNPESSIPLMQLLGPRTDVDTSDSPSTKTRPSRERRKSLSHARSPSKPFIIAHANLTPLTSPSRERELSEKLAYRRKSEPLDGIREDSLDGISATAVPGRSFEEPRKRVSLSLSRLHENEADGNDEIDLETSLLRDELDGPDVWQGGFEKPDRGELVAMMVSGSIVTLLAVAAGLATIFDWVL